ncbi:MAG: hydrogenase maturation protease [Porticoccaceae bacterium]|nr:hydrogenase maturation protease [Porticoccaceae bacterium]
MAGRFLVVGIGNPQRGDDGAGRAVVAWLRGRLPEAVELAVQDGNAAGLFDGFAGAAAVWLVDACVSGQAPGTLQRFDAAAAPLPEALRSCSTHGLGPAQAIELARALGQLPGRCRVHVIEGAEFAPGAGLSPAVAAAVPEVGARIAGEVTAAWRATGADHA